MNKIRRNAKTSTYKKVSGKIKKVKKSFNNIIDRVNVNAEFNCFITIKDHKENFLNQPKVRLINQARNQLGRISKKILDNINMTLFHATKISQCKSMVSAIKRLIR